MQVHTLPTAQVPSALTDSFAWCHDTFTHACKARPLTVVGWTSLSVIVIVIVTLKKIEEEAEGVLETTANRAACQSSRYRRKQNQMRMGRPATSRRIRGCRLGVAQNRGPAKCERDHTPESSARRARINEGDSVLGSQNSTRQEAQHPACHVPPTQPVPAVRAPQTYSTAAPTAKSTPAVRPRTRTHTSDIRTTVLWRT